MNKYQFPKSKKINFNKYSEIMATASYFPQNVVTNKEIIKRNNIGVTDNIIQKTIGTKTRHIAGENMTDSDILLGAAEICLTKANIRPEKLSKLLVTKFIGDRILPMTASIVQRKLGSNLAFHAIDIDGGTNSFLIALDLSTRYISTTQDDEQYILILSGGIHNLIVNDNDPRLAFLFGDGAGAILVKSSERNHFLASYQFSNYHHNYAGSKELKLDKKVSSALFEGGNYSLLYDLYSLENWKNHTDFFKRAITHTFNVLLKQANLTNTDIDFVLITENNKQMHDLALETLGISQNQTISVINEYGNTMSAMLPLAFNSGIENDVFKKGMNIMLLSYGEGISGGGMIYQI